MLYTLTCAVRIPRIPMIIDHYSTIVCLGDTDEGPTFNRFTVRFLEKSKKFNFVLYHLSRRWLLSPPPPLTVGISTVEGSNFVDSSSILDKNHTRFQVGLTDFPVPLYLIILLSSRYTHTYIYIRCTPTVCASLDFTLQRVFHSPRDNNLLIFSFRFHSAVCNRKILFALPRTT